MMINRKQLGTVATVLTIVGVCWTIISDWNPFDDSLRNDDDFNGIWYSEFSHPITGGISHIKGTTEYFPNGRYNFIGVIQYEIDADDNITITVTYDVDSTGEWSNNSDSLLVTMTDMSPHLSSL